MDEGRGRFEFLTEARTCADGWPPRAGGPPGGGDHHFFAPRNTKLSISLFPELDTSSSNSAVKSESHLVD
jgi:hypothetical protein